MDKTSLLAEALDLMNTTTKALSALKDIITAMSTDGRRSGHYHRNDERHDSSPYRRDNRERSPYRRDNQERHDSSPYRRDNREQPYQRRERNDNRRDRNDNRRSTPMEKIFRRKDKDLLKIVLKKTTAVPSSPSYSPTSPTYCPTSPIWTPEEKPKVSEAILGAVIGWEPCV